MSQQTRLIIALAAASSDDLTTQFSESDMAVIAWQHYPHDFGISGRPEHPDTKKLSVLLYGRMRRLLRKVAPGRWSLTSEAIEEARRVMGVTSAQGR